MTNVIPASILNPNSMVPVPAILGWGVRNSSGLQPVVGEFPFSASSAIARMADMATISSGQISRGSGSSSTLAGFFCDGSFRTENAQIPAMPFLNDQVSGIALKALRLYLAGFGNEFTAQIPYTQTLTAAMVGQAACDFIAALLAPTPTLSTAGTAGATTRYYSAIPVNAIGEALGVNGTALTTSNATNSATNYNIITIPYVAGAVWFNIYRGTSNSNGTLIGTVVANPSSTGTTVFNDTGLTATTGATWPTTNNSGWVLDPTTTSVGQCQIFQLVDPIGTVSAPGIPTARVRFRIPSTIQAL